MFFPSAPVSVCVCVSVCLSVCVCACVCLCVLQKELAVRDQLGHTADFPELKKLKREVRVCDVCADTQGILLFHQSPPFLSETKQLSYSLSPPAWRNSLSINISSSKLLCEVQSTARPPQQAVQSSCCTCHAAQHRMSQVSLKQRRNCRGWGRGWWRSVRRRTTRMYVEPPPNPPLFLHPYYTLPRPHNSGSLVTFTIKRGE